MSQIVDAEAGQFRTFADDGPMRLEVLERPAIDMSWEQELALVVAGFFHPLEQLHGVRTERDKFLALLFRVSGWLAPEAVREVDVCPLRLERLALA